jgi:uncharacterized membrane protein YhaH (DUF805 family)
MDFQSAVTSCFARYSTFTGRARRPEFWWFALFVTLGTLAFAVIDRAIFGPAMMPMGGFGRGFGLPDLRLLASLFGLAVLLPALAVGARRLHDTGRSGWWQGLLLIPVVGPLLLAYWFVQPSAAGRNRFGPAPKVNP